MPTVLPHWPGVLWLKRSKATDGSGDVVFLEEPDGGDSGGSGIKTKHHVFEGDAAEADDGDGSPAGLTESVEARGCGAGSADFFENRGEYREVCAVDGGLSDLFRSMAGDGDNRS